LAAADEIATLDAKAILFSQSNVRKTLPKIVESMRANGWRGNPIDVVRQQNGTLIAVDNTRLLAAKLTGTPVQARIRAFDEVFPVARDPDNLFFSSLATGNRPASVRSCPVRHPQFLRMRSRWRGFGKRDK